MTYDVILKEPGRAKLGVVKVVKDWTYLGLKEAKDLVDAASIEFPSIIKSNLTKNEALLIKRELEDAGATVEILYHTIDDTTYDVILRNVGAQKLGVVKTIIDLNGSGLKEAKDLADSIDPRANKIAVIRRTQHLAEAEAVKTALENAGAEVEIINNTTLETLHLTTGILASTFASTTTFTVVNTGSIIQYNTISSQGLIGITGEPGIMGVAGEKPFRINYRSKDGEDKTEVIQATSLEEAKSKITDLEKVNYHIG